MVIQDRIIHVAIPDAWERAQPTGRYSPDGYETEGFIHCCARVQLEGVLRDHFSGQECIVLLVLDTAKVSSPIRYERAANGEDYPHVYGPIEVTAVVDEIDVRFEDGAWRLPA